MSMSTGPQGGSSAEIAVRSDGSIPIPAGSSEITGIIRVRPFAPRWLPAAILLLMGFGIRLWVSTQCHLNPDEALHYHTAHQPTLIDTYYESKSKAHPPLYFLLLHVWLQLGTTEAVLRSLSVLAGTFALWGAYRWIVRLYGESAGLIGMGILTFAPMMISLSTEVRHYALLLWFEVYALIAVEDVCGYHPSPKAVLRYFFWLTLALLTHYSAVWLVAATALYGTWRLLRNRSERKIVVWWFSALGLIAVLAGLLLYSHVSQLSGSALEQSAADGWLRPFYFHAADESLVRYLIRNTVGLFLMLFGLLPDFYVPGNGQAVRGIAASFAICVMLVAMYVMSLALVYLRIIRIGPLARPLLPRAKSRPIDSVVLLTLPIAIAAAAGVLGKFPYGSTRHVAFLLPFLAAGLGVFPAHLIQDRRRIIAIAWVVLGPLWFFGTITTGPFNNPAYHRREHMERAVKYVHATISVQRPLIMDAQTFEVMGYYLNQGETVRPKPLSNGIAEARVGGRRALIVQSEWTFTAENYPGVVKTLQATVPELHGRVAWVVGQSWGSFYGTLVDKLPPEVCRNPQKFGEGLVVFLTPF
jgi:4-amino-4-deoxy-L-arabinose transferase-like glycosyltransferase